MTTPPPPQQAGKLECPGDECPMCIGESCNKCGAGCWARIGTTNCQHDVVERHQEAERQRSE